MISSINMISESSYNLWGHVEGGESILHYQPPVADLFHAKGIVSEGGRGEQKHREEQSWWTRDNRDSDRDKKSSVTK